MIRSTVSCLQRLRFGARRWWTDVDLLRTTWHAATANAIVPVYTGEGTPTSEQLDQIAAHAQALNDGGTPHNIVRIKNKTLLTDATLAQVRAMRAAILRIDYFPTRTHAPARDGDAPTTTAELALGAGANDQTSPSALDTVLQVPIFGEWSDRTVQVGGAHGDDAKTFTVRAEASVGDLFLQSVQMAPFGAVPLLDRVSLLLSLIHI